MPPKRFVVQDCSSFADNQSGISLDPSQCLMFKAKEYMNTACRIKTKNFNPSKDLCLFTQFCQISIPETSKINEMEANSRSTLKFIDRADYYLYIRNFLSLIKQKLSTCCCQLTSIICILNSKYYEVLTKEFTHRYGEICNFQTLL